MTAADHRFAAPARLSVIAVRHGSTDLTGVVLNGSGPDAADPDLNADGRRECERLRERLAVWGMCDRLRWAFTSPARRAITSAQVLTGAPAITDTRLREVEFGRWEGQSVEAVWLGESALVSRWRRDARVAPPGGTALVEVAQRVREWRAQCHAEVSHGDHAVALVVAHASTVRILVADALGLPLEHADRVSVGPATAAVVSYWADGGSALETLTSS